MEIIGKQEKLFWQKLKREERGVLGRRYPSNEEKSTSKIQKTAS